MVVVVGGLGRSSGGSEVNRSKQMVGVMLTLCGVLTHVCASVYNEVLFKNKPTQSIWLQNLMLYSWSLLLNTISFIVMCVPRCPPACFPFLPA